MNKKSIKSIEIRLTQPLAQVQFQMRIYTRRSLFTHTQRYFLLKDSVMTPELTPKVYTQVKPKILLEQITKRTSLLIFLITYATFLLCLYIDVQVTYLTVNNDGEREFPYTKCADHTIFSLNSDWSCTVPGTVTTKLYVKLRHSHF